MLFALGGRAMDCSVAGFVFRMLDERWYALEQPNKGLMLLQQWDDLLIEQHWHLFQVPTALRQGSLCCWVPPVPRMRLGENWVGWH